MADSGYYSYKESKTVTLPMASNAIAIEKRDWDRLKKSVNNSKENGQWFKSFAFCFFGVSGSAFITWLSLLSQENLEITKLILLIVTIVALVLGLAFISFQLYFDKGKSTSINSIKEEILFIESYLQMEES